MGRLIDADELKKDYPHDSDWEYPVNTNEYVCDSIDNAPTVEAIPKEEVRQYIENIQKIKDNHNEHGEPINYGTICGILIEGYELLDKYMEGNGNDC